MGLPEPDIDIDDILDFNQEDEEETDGEDLSDYSKKDLYKKVEKEGRVQISDKKAAIMCPCKKSAMLSDDTKSFMCGLRVESHPDDVSKSVLTCTGPIIGVKRSGISGKETWANGTSAVDHCPYTPFRF